MYVTFDNSASTYLYKAFRDGGAEECDCKRDRLWVQPPLEEMRYLIFSFLSSGVTECLHNFVKNGERSVTTLDSLCLPYCVRDTA